MFIIVCFLQLMQIENDLILNWNRKEIYYIFLYPSDFGIEYR